MREGGTKSVSWFDRKEVSEGKIGATNTNNTNTRQISQLTSK